MHRQHVIRWPFQVSAALPDGEHLCSLNREANHRLVERGELMSGDVSLNHTEPRYSSLHLPGASILHQINDFIKDIIHACSLSYGFLSLNRVLLGNRKAFSGLFYCHSRG
ncbi:hypothetical protein D3C81_1767050 [compost metagenome]